MLHTINKFLVSRGHEVRVILHQGYDNNIKMPYMYEGVEVVAPINHADVYRWADLVITHLDYTAWTIYMCTLIVQKPVINIVHNDFPYESVQNAKRNVAVVYNSEWIKNKLAYKKESFVLPPPVDIPYYQVNENPEQNECITLINLNENKGGEIFYDIARAMPDKKFLGVIGSYEDQIVERGRNIEIVGNTSDIRPVYARTRILIMPSKYESWGRTATEAMCSGIPVICTATDGLKENCAGAALYIKNRDNVDEWVDAIREMDDKHIYNKFSEYGKQRSKELDATENLNKFEEWLCSTLLKLYESSQLEAV